MQLSKPAAVLSDGSISKHQAGVEARRIVLLADSFDWFLA
jgi:hypothetical protein